MLTDKYKIKVGRQFFKWVIFYRTIKCNSDFDAALKLSNCIKSKDTPPSKLHLFEYTKENPKTFIINGKKHFRLIKL